MRELLELNRYLHDFTAAMWVCGSILMWLICREGLGTELSAQSERLLRRLAHRIAWITIPSLIVSLASGGVRAATFRQCEYAGEITSSLVTMLLTKHALFAAVIVWGITVHLRSRRLGRAVQTR